MRNFHLPGRSGVFTSTAMAATSHPIASKVALDLLSKGGNAMDAAIGAAVVQGIAEPQMTGIGGDAFVLYTPAGSQQVKALNGSGRAPAGFDADALRAQGHASIPIFHNAAAVTIPGAVDAFCKLNAEVGRLPLSDVLAPAIHYAEAGIPVAPRVASDWANAVGNLHESARSRYLINGAAPRIGQNFACPDQAKALRLIAENGRAGFYEGAVAQDMVDTLQTLGGVHTLDDFESVTSTTDDPITSTYGAFDV